MSRGRLSGCSALTAARSPGRGVATARAVARNRACAGRRGRSPTRRRRPCGRPDWIDDEGDQRARRPRLLRGWRPNARRLDRRRHAKGQSFDDTWSPRVAPLLAWSVGRTDAAARRALAAHAPGVPSWRSRATRTGCSPWSTRRWRCHCRDTVVLARPRRRGTSSTTTASGGDVFAEAVHRLEAQCEPGGEGPAFATSAIDRVRTGAGPVVQGARIKLDATGVLERRLAGRHLLLHRSRRRLGVIGLVMPSRPR